MCNLMAFSCTLQGNTFQAILTTNGTKSYAVFTYKCGELEWPFSAVIGYNAPVGNTYNHYLSSVSSEQPPADEIACIHTNSQWSNVIIDLETSNIILPVTPPPHFSTGKCKNTTLIWLQNFLQSLI